MDFHQEASRALHDPTALATWALVAATLILVFITIRFNARTIGAAAEQTKAVLEQTKAVEQSLRTDALARLTALWDSPDLRSRRRYVASSVLSSTDAPAELNVREDVVDFFEEVGALLRSGRLDVDLVWHAFADAAEGWWMAHGRAHAARVRADYDDPSLYSEFEYLIEAVERENGKRSAGRHRTYYVGHEREFLESEATLLPNDPIQVTMAQVVGGKRLRTVKLLPLATPDRDESSSEIR